MDKYILMADDDPEDQEMLSDAIADLGSPVPIKMVNNGKDLLQSLSEVTIAPALIVLDLNMPRMNGFEVLGNLKSNPKTSYIPVIVYTTSTSEDAEKLSLARGAIRFISKPATYSGVAIIAQQIVSLIGS